MTEPTPESLSIAHRYASGVVECAREIEQRVAAAVQEERERCQRRVRGLADALPPSFLEQQTLNWAIQIIEQVASAADRPVSEGAAQKQGERWRPIDSAPEDGTVVWVYVASAHGLPAFQGSCAYHRDGGWCADELRPVTHWVPIECVYLPPPTDANGPESSPTQTVAAAQRPTGAECPHGRHLCAECDADYIAQVAAAPPGPTAGDVERTAQAMLNHIGNSDKLNMADQSRRIVTVQLSSADLIGMAKVAINKTRASARAELLAQIREPSEAMLQVGEQQQERGIIAGRELAKKIWRAMSAALADKLTEAK